MANRDKVPNAPLVLIANDQEWSARSLESILGPNGYAVVRAYTGQQALERARTSQPDLIILDAQMPDMHGFEVCRALRADPRFSATTPIVITTSGPSGRTQRLEAYRAGAWEFLGQPLDGEALLLKLGTFLQSKREVDALREENLLDPGSGLYNEIGDALQTILQCIIPSMFKAQQPWALMGSLASVLQGMPRYTPPDIDLVTTKEGAYIMEGCVGMYGATIRPVSLSTAGPYTSHFGIFEVNGIKVVNR